MQTQTSYALHNAIMEAGGKDRPPMLALGSSETTTKRYMENYKNVSQDIRDQLNAKAEAVQIILIGIDNDIYSTFDACPNACEMLKAIKRSQQAATRNRGKVIVNSPPPIYDQEPSIDAEDDEMSKDKEIDKLMALISLSLKKSTNLPTTTFELHQTPVEQIRIILQGLTKALARECQKPKRAKDAAYHKEKMLLCKQEEAGFQLNAEQTDWRDDIDDEPDDQKLELIEIILFIIDSGCSKHMMRNLKLLTNFVEKFLGTVKFGNYQIARILGYGDLVQGTVTIKRVYYVEWLNHNLFSVGQFCDADLEVAFRKSTCYIRDLKGNDLLTGSRGTDLYSIFLQDTSSPNPICLMAKATSSQAWLWHCRLSHLNFDTINFLSKNYIVIGLPS
nr:integrase, catalytic region, zinc finger, CCHC-type, peptidase aspartic, catalytic [Tanacetum cinerariifolium]